MITNETYQDIQILQNHNFQNVITFDATHTMTNTMSYAAVISKDKSHTAFTGPSKTTGTNGTRGNSDAWQSASVTKIYFDVIIMNDRDCIRNVPFRKIFRHQITLNKKEIFKYFTQNCCS